jgi:hypothetical protein
VAERQAFFKRMRALARGVAEAYLAQREALEFPLARESQPSAPIQAPLPVSVTESSDFLLEIGVEELPARDTAAGIESLGSLFKSDVLEAHQLAHGDVRVFGTPRRLVLLVSDLAAREQDSQAELKGPPESASFDSLGKPTQALLGWKRKHQIELTDEELTPENLVRELDGGARSRDGSVAVDIDSRDPCEDQIREVDALERIGRVLLQANPLDCGAVWANRHTLPVRGRQLQQCDTRPSPERFAKNRDTRGQPVPRRNPTGGHRARPPRTPVFH